MSPAVLFGPRVGDVGTATVRNICQETPSGGVARPAVRPEARVVGQLSSLPVEAASGVAVAGGLSAATGADWQPVAAAVAMSVNVSHVMMRCRERATVVASPVFGPDVVRSAGSTVADDAVLLREPDLHGGHKQERRGGQRSALMTTQC